MKCKTKYPSLFYIILGCMNTPGFILFRKMFLGECFDLSIGLFGYDFSLPLIIHSPFPDLVGLLFEIELILKQTHILHLNLKPEKDRSFWNYYLKNLKVEDYLIL